MPRQLLVFDFDWSVFPVCARLVLTSPRSLADQDTDRYIFEVLAPDLRRYMKSAKQHTQWTDLVAQSLQKIHARGITRQQIETTLASMPFHPAMTRATSKLKSEGKTTFFCLSNANSVFISTILKVTPFPSHPTRFQLSFLQSKGLDNLFDQITTNPAEWDDTGLLKLRRRVDPNGPQHTCKVGCSPNMCKGEELDAFIKQHGPFDRIVYTGDGSNDFCPVLRLRSQDIVCCRLHRGLQKRINEEGGLKAEIRYWAGAWEAEEIYNSLSI
ncbi:Pyridoxal phosphate phosphatase PHOSPHO2 [Termitomyces sp. J132]|nr:Pyridoxal phosphate phosphatase PHOSPHO2 [Termitomyces sp. J132]